MSERTLVLLRHGKSDWSGDLPDLDRPLAPRGTRQATEAGRWLAGHLDAVDLALVSPARRARGTWELVAHELANRPPARIDERVYAASADGLLAVVRSLPDEARTAVLVGHNPGLEDLVQRLTGDRVAMPTSAVAVVDLSGAWSGAGGGPAGALRTSGRPPQG